MVEIGIEGFPQRQLMSVKMNLGDEHFSVALIYKIMFL